ncbi:hypothetical protein [Thermomicrobium sp.]|uniref:hypothetical protein n=1 Tax=Thermomicrobium sp. TaxID=1969469 RepID=UPI001B2EC538|nr:hypothetical protein [Thermomicrobium sp.]MBO9308004.1 hypothetical protein [Thermomicrobium sp.]
MGWLDDLRKDPDSTHAKLVRRLYGQRVAAAFATPFISENKDGQRQAIVPVAFECALILLPPTVNDVDEIVIAFPDGKQLCIDRSQAHRWRHMIAIWVATDRADKADFS